MIEHSRTAEITTTIFIGFVGAVLLHAAGDEADESSESEPKQLSSGLENQNNELKEAKMLCTVELKGTAEFGDNYLLVCH